LLVALALLWPAPNPVFLETAQGRYQLLSARYVYGTNLTLSATEDQAKGWLRRQLDRVGIHTKGSRGGSGFAPGIGIHAIALLCKGEVPNEDLAQIDAECITEFGQ